MAAGHHPNRVYVGQDGGLYLNGAEFYDSAGNALKAEIDLLNGLTATAAELNKVDDSLVTMAEGSGFDGSETYAAGAFRNGGLIVTRILIDLTGLIVSATDLDIIGESAAAANCHAGQITAALNGTIVGGRMTCLEVPAGASADIDLYSATVGTGAEDSGIAALTETALVTSGGNWASGTTKGMTAVPAANEYLYLTNGAGAGNGTYTAGKFLIELFGTP